METLLILSNNNIQSEICFQELRNCLQPTVTLSFKLHDLAKGRLKKQGFERDSMRPKARFLPGTPAALSGLLNDLNVGNCQAQSVPAFAAVWCFRLLSLYRCGCSPMRQLGQNSSQEPLNSSQTERQGQEPHKDERDQTPTLSWGTTDQGSPNPLLEPHNLVRWCPRFLPGAGCSHGYNSDSTCFSDPSSNLSAFPQTCSQSSFPVLANATSLS